MKNIIILGEKNVGKSSLFNFLTNEYKSVSINYYGYTRDCNRAITKIFTKFYTVIDTPGIGYLNSDLDILTIKKIWDIIKGCDIVLFVIDLFIFNEQLFYNFVNIFNKSNFKVLYILNKIDLLSKDAIDFFNIKFNINELISISLKMNIGLNNLLYKINKLSDDFNQIACNKSNFFNISIIGKQNVGKSLLFNRLLNRNISIVYDYLGTTRDSIESYLTQDNKNYLLIDTPGVIKKNKLNIYSKFLPNKKVFNVIKKSDMCLIVIDALDIFNKLNIDIIKNAYKVSKFNLIIINKTDMLKKKELFFINNKIVKKFSFLENIQILFLSSKYLFNFYELFNRIDKIKFIQKKIFLNDIFFKIKDNINKKSYIINKHLTIKKIVLKNFNNFNIIVFLNYKKICINHKRYLCALILKQINLKGFSFKFDFK